MSFLTAGITQPGQKKQEQRPHGGIAAQAMGNVRAAPSGLKRSESEIVCAILHAWSNTYPLQLFS